MKDQNLIIGIAVVVFILLFFGGFGMMGFGGYGGMMGLFGYGSNMWVFGWIYMVLIAIILVLIIIWLAKQINKS